VIANWTAARTCQQLGGNVLDGPRMMGGKRFCVIQDPPVLSRR